MQTHFSLNAFTLSRDAMARFQSGSKIRDVVKGGDDEDARRDYCERQLELLASGWHRVRDPAREIDYPDDPRDPGLERVLHENPDDDQTWLVYADHFIDRGHPRGALMALESAPVINMVQRAQREADAHTLRLTAMDVLGGSLAGRAGLNLRWRRGFIHQAFLNGEFDRGAAEDLLFELLRHPSARFLRELKISCSHHDAQDHRLLVATLLHAAHTPPLRTLAIEYATDRWVGDPPLGDVGALGASYPLLEDVSIAGDDTTRFTGISLPRAKRFAFKTTRLQPHALRAIAKAEWPMLEEIELWLDDSPCTLDDVRFVLALPALRRLRVLAAPFANQLVEELVNAPIARQIEHLDLRYGAFDDAGAAVLAAARARFPTRLRCTIVTRTNITRAGRDLLEDADIQLDAWW
jgi:uncharacterized protein (TIGR02996 family)